MNDIFLITGGTSGIGLEIVKGLLAHKKSVGIIARNKELTLSTIQTLKSTFLGAHITYFIGDLSIQSDVKRLANEILARCQSIACLINNAGVVMGKHTVTKEGLETTFSVNHMSHFLLTQLLLQRLQEYPHARIINMASNAHKFVNDIRFDDIGWRNSYRPLKVYGQSKLAVVLFTRDLASRLKGTFITVNGVDPGAVATRIGCNNGRFARFVSACMRPFFRPVPKGAETAIYLALSDEVKGISGEVFKDKKIIQVSPAASSEALAHKLWSFSEQLCAQHLQ